MNYDLFKLIPPDADRVVEIGCGDGTLGEQYRKINRRCKYVGIEINPQAAAEAVKRLSAVLIGNAEAINLQEDNIDCLVYDGVLQQMVDPWTTLKRQVARLNLGGQVIACIPNIQHWTVITSLLQGKWQCQKGGVSDSSQLQFFTLDRIRDLFANAGLTIFEIRTKSGQQEGIEQFQEIIRPVVERLGINPKAFFEQTGALQYVIRAVKGSAPTRRLLLHTMLGETKVCARVRINEPHSFLATIPGVRNLSEVKIAHLDRTFPGENKVFIWQRMLVDNIVKQQELLRRGYLIIAEFDDDPLRWPGHQANDFLTFRSCHGVQVSTEPLARFLRQYNPNVTVFPNQLAYLPAPRTYDESLPLTVFFGALNRELDWLPIMPLLNKVLHQYKCEVKVTVIHDRKFFDALTISNKEYLPFCSYNQYEAALHSADIAILPLQFNRFNSMKSDLKFLECAAHGVTVLASPTVYAQSIVDEETGLIYHNQAEFEEKLLLLMEDRKMRLQISQNAYDWVAKYRLLCQHYRDRYNWYQAMFDRLPELNHSLEQRVPGILSQLLQR